MGYYGNNGWWGYGGGGGKGSGYQNGGGSGYHFYGKNPWQNFEAKGKGKGKDIKGKGKDKDDGGKSGKRYGVEMTTCPTPGCDMQWKASSNPRYCYKCWKAPLAAEEFDATSLLESLLSEGMPKDRASKLLAEQGFKVTKGKKQPKEPKEESPLEVLLNLEKQYKSIDKLIVDKVGRVAGILQLLEDQEAILLDLEAQKYAIEEEIQNLKDTVPCFRKDENQEFALKEGSNPAEVQKGVQAFLQTVYTNPTDAASFNGWREQLVGIVQGIASTIAPIPEEIDDDDEDNDGGLGPVAFGDLDVDEDEQPVFPDAADDNTILTPLKDA
jgi:hypothetical protein